MKTCKTCEESTARMESESCLNCGAFFPLPQDEVKMIIENFLNNHIGGALRASFICELENYDDDLHQQLESELSYYNISFNKVFSPCPSIQKENKELRSETEESKINLTAQMMASNPPPSPKGEE